MDVHANTEIRAREDGTMNDANVPDELFEGMMDRRRHSVSLAACKRTCGIPRQHPVAFYSVRPLHCNSRGNGVITTLATSFYVKDRTLQRQV